MEKTYNRKYFVQSGSWALFGIMMSIILGLTINVLITRMLPAEDVGCYFLLVSYVSFCTILSQAGILQVLLRKVAISPIVDGRRGAGNEVISACLYVAFGIAIVGSMSLLFFDFWVDKFNSDRQDIKKLLFLVILWTAVLSYQGIVTETFRGLNNIRNAVLFGGILTNAMIAISLGIFYFVRIKTVLHDVVIIVIGLMFLTLITGFSLLVKQIINTENGRYWNRLKSMFHEATPLMFSGLLMMVITQGDLWIVGYYLGNEDTALYGVAAKLSILTAMPLNLINSILPPHISQLNEKNRIKDLEKLLRTTAGLASIPAILMALGAIFLGKDLLAYLYGENFRQAGPLLSVLCLGQLAHVLLGPSGIVLMLTGRGKALVYITFTTCLCLIVGGTRVAPYGLIWVGTIAAITLVIQKILMCMVVNSGLKIKTYVKINMELLRIFNKNISR